MKLHAEMLVQQPQSKSKIVTVQADAKLQEMSWNQQENQHFSAGAEKPIRFLDIIPALAVARPLLPGTTVYETNQQILFGWSRMVSIRVLCNPGACSLRACKCLMYLTVHSCVKGSKGFRCITSLLWVLWVQYFAWVAVLVPVRRFRKHDFIPLRTDVVGTWSIRCNRLSLESRAGYRLYGGSYS